MAANARARSPDIGEYAVLGCGRTTALVSRAGVIDWLCLPELDGAPVLSALLDRGAGGFFALAPSGPAEAVRRYRPATNVLETTWTSAGGAARVTDALAGGPGRTTGPAMLIRRVQGLRGTIRIAWSLAPRFGDGRTPPTAVDSVPGGLRFGGPGPALVLGAQDPLWDGTAASGTAEIAEGSALVLTLGCSAPPPRPDAALRELSLTSGAWEDFSARLTYEGPWREPVLRSTLALRLLVRESTGAIAAAATLGLPEQPGGERNYDYRYCWLRDSSFVVDAFANVGDRETPRRFLEWLAGALSTTTPDLHPVYRLDGGTVITQREAEVAGYRGATPVRIGNRAARQTQLGSYGDVLQACALVAEHGLAIPAELALELARAVEHLQSIWREDDGGIWETTPPRAHTWSKMACWVAFTRAAELAEDGRLEGDSAAWRVEAERVRAHVEEHHYDEERGAYVAVAGERGLDAAVLLGVLMGYPPTDPARWTATLAAIDEELGAGPLLYRTTELRGQEQTFLPCAFWRAHALVRLGRFDEARDLLDALVGYGGDLGLFSEEAAPDGTCWGNLPQALTHAAFVNAAITYAEQRSGG